MAELTKLVGIVIWMFVIPFSAGLLPCALLPKEKRTPGVICLAGYLLTFAVFELTALPILLLTERGNFQLLTVLFTILMLLPAAVGLVLCGGPGGLTLPSGKPGREETVYWIIFAAILCFELYMSYTHMFFDGDDAYYVAASVITNDTGTMYRILPYTGGATSLDVRHALALFPMWIAYLARITGMHPAAITHSVLPLLMIPLSDLALYQIAKRLLKDRRPQIAAFMAAAALLQVFGNVSIYTPETFLLMRSWQGKSIFVNWIVPMVFGLFLCIAGLYRSSAEEKAAAGEKKFVWLLLVLLNLTSGLCTSMAAIMNVGLLFLCALFTGIAVHDRKVLRNTALACIPNFLYIVLLYALLK
ncbi:MAG: DUF6077 domain-containing protein [Lachnospiraceae bacterium]|jgi:hypothetical protein|nr:DUF6077 domain-containing protein [Lachnospiraceae bacterium]